MELSVPLQFTSSIQIFPVPVKRGAHSFLAVIREAERRRKGNMPVNDMTMAGPAGGLLKSGGGHLPSALPRMHIYDYGLASYR